MEWICPGRLQQICLFEGDKPEIVLEYANRVLANLDFWTPYEVTMRANANFVQGTGLTYSEGTVEIMWVNVEMGDGVIEPFDDLVERRDTNVFTVEFSGTNDKYLKLKWVITPEIPSINGEILNQKQITIPANTLEAGATYILEA